MCPTPSDKCGPKLIEIKDTEAKEVIQGIRNLSKGEVCNYRVKVSCGAPAFSVTEGGQWSSSLSDFNITYNEFEGEDVEFENPNFVSSFKENSVMPMVNTTFIYYMFDMQKLVTMSNMTDVMRRPKKGIYNTLKKNWHAFNNIEQTQSADNGFT